MNFQSPLPISLSPRGEGLCQQPQRANQAAFLRPTTQIHKYMHTPHHTSAIEILKNTALEAGAIVRKGFSENKDITHKGTVDLVTQYDLATEQFILEKLQAAFPEHTLIGEESHQGNFGQKFDKAI